jgi:acetolactate synthase-1/2/3 large subunit
MDLPLGFGGAFGEETELIVLDAAESERDHPRAVAAELFG